MTYITILARVQLAQSNAQLLGVVGDLAERFGAEISGLALCRNLADIMASEYATDALIEEMRARTSQEIDAAEAAFRIALTSRAPKITWHAGETGGDLSEACARYASAADLIVMAPDNVSMFNSSYHFNIGDLLMRAGRPVLVVPPGTDGLKLDHVLVGWKESREARRAIVDALPLLKEAGHVVLAEIVAQADEADARERLSTLAGWLALHGVKAEAMVQTRHGSDGVGLAQLARDQHADLIVAGAYGHSRVREWVLGGVTCDLLLTPPCPALLSH